MIRAFLPHGLSRTFDWQTRFEALGYTRAAALGAVVSRSKREMLVTSRIEHLPPALRTGLSLVVDVGANTGQWLSALQTFVNVERAEIFEPNPASFEILRSNLGKHSGFHFYQTALGNEPGKSTLHVTRSSSLSSLLQPSDTLETQYTAAHASVVCDIEVPVTTLDDALPLDSVVDLLKIDVQGFERPVLMGGSQTLKRTKALMIEMNLVSHYDGDDTFASLSTLVTHDFGFEFWDMSLPHRGPDGRALWADAVFVNPKAPIFANDSNGAGSRLLDD